MNNLGAITGRGPCPADGIALIDYSHARRNWSTAELERAADLRAQELAAGNLRPGQRVAILGQNSAQFLTTYFGIMRAGLIAVPVNYRFPPETIAYILRDADVALTFVDPEFQHLLPGSARFRLLADSTAVLSGARGAARIVQPGPEDVAEILYTSGSTGRPKGVALTHAGQLWALQQHISNTPLIHERTIVAAPLYHMNALFFVSVALLNGMQAILMPRFDAREYLTLVAKHRCTLLSGIPTMFAMMARERELLDRLDLSSVRRILIGSAPLTEALIERVRKIFPNASIGNRYGTTEGGPSVFGEHPDGLEMPLGSVGHPLKDVQWRLTGGPSDVEGVLQIKTPAVLKEYINLPHLMRERVREGWYDTGDVMRRDENGFFYFVGRADDMFVCGGENIYPGEIERLLEQHPTVMQAAVVAVPDDIKGAIPIAFVVPVPGRQVSPEEVRAYSLRAGPAFSHPRAVIVVDHLPVAGTHKVDKQALLAPALAAARELNR